jgi:hypothetical protein
VAWPARVGFALAVLCFPITWLLARVRVRQ